MDPRIDMLIESLERSRQDLSGALAEVPIDLREVRPQDGGWSVANVIEHLAITERSVTRLVRSFIEGAEQRPDTELFDQPAFERRIGMDYFLDRSVKIQGPQPIGDMMTADAWHALEATRADLREAMDSAQGLRLDDRSRPHPATKQPMNAYQWIAFVGLHESRHAAQVREISARLAPSEGHPSRC